MGARRLRKRSAVIFRLEAGRSRSAPTVLRSDLCAGGPPEGGRSGCVGRRCSPHLCGPARPVPVSHRGRWKSRHGYARHGRPPRRGGRFPCHITGGGSHGTVTPDTGVLHEEGAGSRGAGRVRGLGGGGGDCSARGHRAHRLAPPGSDVGTRSPPLANGGARTVRKPESAGVRMDSAPREGRIGGVPGWIPLRAGGAGGRVCVG